MGEGFGAGALAYLVVGVRGADRSARGRLVGRRGLVGLWGGLHARRVRRVRRDRFHASVVGLRLATRRPDSRMGALLVGSALLWVAAGAARVGFRSVNAATAVLSIAYDPVLLHATLIIPRGRLTSRPERAFAAAGYLFWPALLLVGWPLAVHGGPFAVLAPDWLRPRLEQVGGGTVVALRDATYPCVAPALLALYALRYARAAPRIRRAFTPLWIANVLHAATTGLDSLHSGPLSAWPHIAFLVGAAAIPVGAALSVARSQPHPWAVRRLMAELVGSLRRALADPDLELIGPPDEAGIRLNVRTGSPVGPLPEVPGVTPLGPGRSGSAVLVHDPMLASDPELLRAVARMAGLVLENRRLLDEVQRQLAAVRDSRRRLVEAADHERRRIERNIHDGVQQRLIAAALLLRRAQRGAGVAEGTDMPAELIAQGAGELEKAIAELRELARGMNPPLLEQYGLAGAVESIAERSAVVVEVDDGFGAGDLPDDVATSAYYVTLEAVTNAGKHAPAATVSVGLAREAGGITVTVRDDGPGGAVATPGGGLAGLRDRVDACGGTLTVISDPGAGTIVRARLPVHLHQVGSAAAAGRQPPGARCADAAAAVSGPARVSAPLNRDPAAAADKQFVACPLLQGCQPPWSRPDQVVKFSDLISAERVRVPGRASGGAALGVGVR
jgi:signal transduction histidine kinase